MLNDSQVSSGFTLFQTEVNEILLWLVDYGPKELNLVSVIFVFLLLGGVILAFMSSSKNPEEKNQKNKKNSARF